MISMIEYNLYQTTFNPTINLVLMGLSTIKKDSIACISVLLKKKQKKKKENDLNCLNSSNQTLFRLWIDRI